ncbi:MAG: flippase [Pseudanabaena sp.]|jgi:PST family polysaccharide transporter
MLTKLKQLKSSIHNRLHPEQLKIIKNIGWLASERVFRLGVSFVTMAWTARYLGVDQFGYFNYAFAFVSMFTPLLQLASDSIIFRDLINHPEKKEEILGTAFFIQFIIGVIIFCLSTVAVLLFHSSDPLIYKLVIILGTGSCLVSFGVIESWFNSLLEVKYPIWVRNSVFSLATLSRVILLSIKAPIEYFAWLVVAESLLNAIGFTIVFRMTGHNILAWRSNWKYAKELMKVSFPLIFSSLAIAVYMRIDLIMLGQLSSPQAVGTYSAAVKLSELWPFASTMLVKSIAPSIIAAKKVSEESYYRKLQNLCNLQAILVYCIAIPMTFLATPFVVLVFGKDYAPSGIVLSIHIWSSMFLFLGYVKEIWITTEGKTWFAFAFTIVGATMNVLLNFILIPPYKEIGAAVATVISYCFADYVMCFVYPSVRRFGWMMTQAMSLNLIKPKF